MFGKSAFKIKTHLLSKHGRYGRFQPYPVGLFPYSKNLDLGKGLGDLFNIFLIDFLGKVKFRRGFNLP